MQTYETTATVEGEGQLRIAGVPFPPGTPVEVTISPQHPAPMEAARTRLLAALDKSRNNVPIGRLRREELYDRDNVH